MTEADRPAPSIPPAPVAAAAEAARFGAHLGTEPQPPGRLTAGGHLLAFGVVLTIVGGCAAAVFASRSATAVAGVLLGTAGTVTALGFAASRRFRPNPTLYCYERGAVAEPRSGGEPRIHPWPAVRTREWAYNESAGHGSYPVQVLELLTADRQEIVRYYGKQAERLKAVLAEVSTRPRADDDSST
jgi:hypothetical protein